MGIEQRASKRRAAFFLLICIILIFPVAHRISGRQGDCTHSISVCIKYTNPIQNGFDLNSPELSRKRSGSLNAMIPLKIAVVDVLFNFRESDDVYCMLKCLFV